MPFFARDRLHSLTKDFLLIPFLMVLTVFNISIILETAKITPFLSGELRQKLSNYGVASSYGLFSDMTTIRKEIVFEGFWNDSWSEIEFKYKPGNLNKALQFIAPFHPRLDWQMWFAALGSPYQNPWLFKLTKGILQGNKAYESFFKNLDYRSPPLKVRAYIYDYHFSRDNNIWSRENKNVYLPELEEKNFKK